jgi:hypothetical protein
MEYNTLLTGFIAFMILCAAIVIILWLIFEWGLIQIKREDAFNDKYDKIQKMIYKLPVTKTNRLKIVANIIELERMKHKDWDKVGVLRSQLADKYDEGSCEHSPESIFCGE